MASKTTRKATPKKSTNVARPAPYKGLNSIASLAAMENTYAISMQNFIVTPQGLAPRLGYKKWATGFSTTVTTLLPYSGKSVGSNKLFAIAGASIYDISSGGAIGSPVVTGLNTSNTYWQSARQTYTTGNANYMIIVNGVDYPRLYDGTNWTTCTQSATPSGVGQFNTVDNNGNAVTISNFVDVVLHQQRLWFVPTNSTKAYYASIASVGGNLGVLDFGPLFARGGYLHKLETWTMDIGSTAGTQSMLVAISSRGDVCIFAGKDPADSASWTLIGNYQLGSPVGRRCTIQYQGDLMILSQDGLYPLSKYLQSARLDSTAALTYTIAPTISSLTTTNSNLPGFELSVYPPENVLLLNVPTGSTDSNFQFCYHTISNAWSQFTGWPATCFAVHQDQQFFGSGDHVGLAFSGYADAAALDGTGGNKIVATCLQAFDQFSDVLPQGSIKRPLLVKPYLTTGSVAPSVAITVNTDFSLQTLFGGATLGSNSGSAWNIAIWDSGSALWQGALTTNNQWASPVCYPGKYLAFAVSISVDSDTLWSATDWVISHGSGV